MLEPARHPAFRDHPQRATAQNEIHARPIVPISAPDRVRRVVFVLEPDPRASAAAFDRFAAWCRATGLSAPSGEMRRFAYRLGERRIVWELHNEFVTFTWSGGASDADHWPMGIGLEIESEAGNGIASATRVDLVDASTIPEQAITGFDQLHLCRSFIENGRAEVATDFTVDAAGFTRFELAAGSLGPNLAGIVVRRLLEIETYRVLTLLGLPLSRTVSPAIGTLETRLADALAQTGRAATTVDNRTALARLQELQIEAQALSHETRYRFSAGAAYGRVLARRLDSLGETPSGEFRSIKRYLIHRIDPALATFAAIARRQDALGEQMAQATNLLNVRIGIDVQAQTQTILATMAATARNQLRLQTTVEDLSTIAISYYALGILGTIVKGAHLVPEADTATVGAVLAPFVLLATWFGLRRIHRAHRD